jgi:hypothetical protein
MSVSRLQALQIGTEHVGHGFAVGADGALCALAAREMLAHRGEAGHHQFAGALAPAGCDPRQGFAHELAMMPSQSWRISCASAHRDRAARHRPGQSHLGFLEFAADEGMHQFAQPRRVACWSCNSARTIPVVCCHSSACRRNRMAALLGKYWYTDPTLTPARSATRAVVKRVRPSRSKT